MDNRKEASKVKVGDQPEPDRAVELAGKVASKESEVGSTAASKSRLKNAV